LRARAVLEAAAAEVILISLTGADELPAHALDWMESWPARPERGQGVLVALIGGDLEKAMRRRSQITYLKGIAASRGLDFLCNHDTGETADIFTPAAALVERAERWREGTLEPNFRNTVGINE
jgi:hypothetical protein